VTRAWDRFHDDVAAIPNNAVLYRRVSWDKIGGEDKYEDGQEGRLNGNCFTDYPAAVAQTYGFPGPCMSVGFASILSEQGYEPEKLLEGFDDYGLARILARDLRSLLRADGVTPCAQGIMFAPTEKEPWHTVVFDVLGGPRKAAVCKSIADVATWELPLVAHRR
jgi:hypothetical protein